MSSGLLPPLPSAHLVDPHDRLVSLPPGACRRTRRSRPSARRNHDVDVGCPHPAQSGVERPSVVCPIAPKGSHGQLEPIEDRFADHRVVRCTLGEHGRLDEAVGANGEVELPPATSLVRSAVLVGVPLAAAHDLQAGGVDDQMNRASMLVDMTLYLYRPTSPGQRGVVHPDRVVISSSRPIKPISEATKPSVCLRARWNTVRRVRAVRIARCSTPGRVPPLSTRMSRGARIPGPDRTLVEPDGQVASASKGLLVRGPVPHTILRLYTVSRTSE